MTGKALARGSRALPAALFPWLPQALATIGTYRQRFEELEHTPEEEKFHFHAVVSLFGARGSGKTSALLTLLREHRQTHPQDLVLAPIDPHRFHDDDNVLFWLLAALRPHVTRLSLPNADPPRGGAPMGDRSETFRPPWEQKSLEALYHEVHEISAALYQASGTATEKGRLEKRFRQHYLARGLELTEKLGVLVRELTDAHRDDVVRRQRGSASSSEAPPLLLLAIDDADLVPQYLDSLLGFIRILSPAVSRLVILITADETMARIGARQRYLKDAFGVFLQHPGLSHQVIDWSELGIEIDNLASQFLTKFLPHEGRYHLLPFGEAQRMEFRPPPATKQLFHLLGDAELGRFFSLDWALAVGEAGGALWSPLVDLVPDNPRLLEQAYDLLERAAISESASRTTGGNAPKRRQELLEALGRFIDATMYPKEVEVLRAAVDHVETAEERRLFGREGVEIRVRFAPLRAEALRSAVPPAPAASTRVYGSYTTRMTVHRRGAAAMAPVAIPEGLAHAYLFLQELSRKGFTDHRLAGSLPGLSLNRIGPVRVARQPPNEPTLHLETIYPLAIVAEGSGSLYCLPMPAWPYPTQWWVFARFWDLIWRHSEQPAAAEPGRFRLNPTEGKRHIFLLHHLITCAIRISKMDPLAAGDSPRLDVHERFPGDAGAALDQLQRPYFEDIVGGEGLLAAWVEEGLYRFLKIVAAELGSELRPLGLQAEEVRRRVIEPTIQQLSRKYSEMFPTESIMAEIDQPTAEGSGRSRLYEALREKLEFAGAAETLVGDLGEP